MAALQIPPICALCDTVPVGRTVLLEEVSWMVITHELVSVLSFSCGLSSFLLPKSWFFKLDKCQNTFAKLTEAAALILFFPLVWVSWRSCTPLYVFLVFPFYYHMLLLFSFIFSLLAMCLFFFLSWLKAGLDCFHWYCWLWRIDLPGLLKNPFLDCAVVVYACQVLCSFVWRDLEWNIHLYRAYVKLLNKFQQFGIKRVDLQGKEGEMCH